MQQYPPEGGRTDATHRDNMWHHNFGIGGSLWDRLFGTYRATDWSPNRRAREYPLREFVNIRWR